MFSAPLVLVLGWAAVLFGALSTIAQFARIRQHGTDGVSLGTWSLFSLMGVFWTAYGVAQRDAIIILGSLPLLPIQLALVARLRPIIQWRVVVRSVAAALVFSAVPTILWGWDAGVFGTGVLMVLNRGPQIVELVRTRGALGVSTATWLLGATGSALWVLFYVGERLWAPLIATAFAGLASLSVAALAAWRHAQVDERVAIGDVVLA